MADGFVVCPFCGFEFEPEDTLCQHGCPMHTTCGLIRCPSCDYEFPEKPAAVSWFGRLFRKARSEPPCGLYCTLAELETGSDAEVISVPVAGRRRDTLAVFGLVPEMTLTLLQKRPACVVRVGETELALDPEIADGIVVKRSPELVERTPASG